MTPLLVHEWIERTGGSENVFEKLAAIYPDAEIFCLWKDHDRLPDRRVRESWLSSTPLRRSKAAALPLMIPTWRLSTRRFHPDFTVISSHLFAHHARVEGPKWVYVHTPARYIWAPELDKRGSSTLVRLAAAMLKPIDRARASEAESFAANSAFVRERIAGAWDRDAVVIPPPVEVERLQGEADWTRRLSQVEAGIIASLPNEFILGASRLVAYKRLDLAIKAGELVGLPVVIVGGGPEEASLRVLSAHASVPVHFLGSVSNELLYAVYQRAAVFVFPAIEDFGIMPVEAMALGTPVVVSEVGGAMESLDHVGGGLTFDIDSPSDLKSAVSAAIGLRGSGFEHSADFYSAAAFDARIKAWLP